MIFWVMVVLFSVLTVAAAFRLTARILGYGARARSGLRPGEVRIMTTPMLGGPHIPVAPLPAAFFIFEDAVSYGQFRVRKLTFARLLWYSLVGEVAWTVWAALWVLWRVGVLENQVNARLPATLREFRRALRLRFWRTPGSLWDERRKGGRR